MKADIVTIFPDFFRGPLEYGITRRAQEMGLAEIRVHDLRKKSGKIVTISAFIADPATQFSVLSSQKTSRPGSPSVNAFSFFQAAPAPVSLLP